MPDENKKVIDNNPASEPVSTDPGRAFQFVDWEYIEILARQLPFVFVFTVSSMLTALALTYIASEKYEAATTIFYRPIEVTRLRTQEARAFGSPVPAAAFTVIGKTIEELLLSQHILERVVDILDLDIENQEDFSNAAWYIRYYEMTKDYLMEQADTIWAYLKYGRIIEANKTDAAINTLRKNISIEIDDSYISYIIVRDKNNIRAAATVDTLAEELIIWLKNKERGPLKHRKRQLNDALDEKQIEINTNRKLVINLLTENKTSSIEHELEQGNIRISTLESSRINVLVDINNYDTEIKAIENKLKQQNDKPQQGGGRIQADDFKRLTSESISLSIGLEGARAKYETLQKEIVDLKNRLLMLSQLDIEYQRLNGELNTASRDHLLISDALQEVIVRAHSIDSEVGILHKAVIPLEPVSPIKIYHVSLATVLGLIVSIGLVYLLNFFNIRILFTSSGMAARRKPVTQEGSLSKTVPSEGNKAET